MDKNTCVAYAWFGAIFATMIALAGSLYVAHGKYLRTVERNQQQQIAKLAGSGTLVVIKTEGLALPLDPASAQWDEAPTLDVEVLPQTIAAPVLETATIKNVRIQSLSDDQWIAWRLGWDDPTQDMNVDAGRFCDAVAIQLPLTRYAQYTMGDKNTKVQILHWKALWQKDIDEQFQDVQDLHPNYWTDMYWFAEGEFPYRVPGAFSDPVSRQWFAAEQARNPVSQFGRKQPTEELIAAGYGTLTTQPVSVTVGRGAWTSGRWTVVFARPKHTDDPADYQFGAGGQKVLSLAVWDGSAGNSGGRKHWSNWIPFEVQP